MARLLVLDFDGTMTDAEVEGAPYRLAYLEDLAVLTGLPLAQVTARAAEIEAEIRADQGRYGWLFEGRIVAPAGVDPYLRIMPVARRLLDEAGVFLAEPDRTRLLDGILYKHNYGRTAVAFRAGAADALAALEGTETWIVTNSHTDPVQRKLRVLAEQQGRPGSLDWLVARVLGTARKYVIDDTCAAVDAAMSLPGLDRPVLLRRRLYLEALERLRDQAGVVWADVLVVGDIFELDLALPMAMGAQVGLVVNDFTPAYERRWVEAHPRGTLMHSLAELPAMMGR